MKIVRFIRRCALVAVGLISLQSAHPAKPDASRVITILALGDSLTDGFGLSRKEAYPALIAEKMKSANYRFEVINAGSSGDDTSDGLRRLPALLLGKKIDVLILALGVNDAFRGVPIEQMRSNLQAIIDRTRARHPNVSIIIAGCSCRWSRAMGMCGRSEKCLARWPKRIARR